MKRCLSLIMFSFILVLGLYAQSQSEKSDRQAVVNISGTVVDASTQEPIEQAGIRILNSKDSTYVKGTATNSFGRFSVDVNRGRYIVQVTYIGYTDAYVNINASKAKNDLQKILMKDDGILLSEAVVVGKAPDIVVKGDTVEYNADSYRVQESAVLEDLIKKIPGAEIDSDGKIKVNGKDISKILVDGKEFFSDDPKTASKNLPAKIVDKLQVLDKKSDMAQLTGFDDGEEETVINLVIKEGMKQGMMANFLGGYGSEDMYEANGFLNYAQNDTRVSVLGNFNNNNNANANTRSSNRGLLETSEGGVNFAAEPSKKFKWDGDAYYGHTENDVESESSTEYVDGIRSEKNNSSSVTKKGSFVSRFRMEWSPDSATKIIFRPNLNYTKNDSYSNSNGENYNSEEAKGNILSESYSNSDGHTLSFSGNLLINRKLNNKGRSVSMELQGGYSDGDTDGLFYSKNDYNQIDSLVIDNRKSNQNNNSYNWRVRLSYLEPVGWNNFLELAYSIRNTVSETDKVAYNYDEATQDYTELAESYTRNTKNNFLNQNVSLSFQSRRQRYNYTLGLGVEPSNSKTETMEPKLTEKKITKNNTFNFAPRAEFNYLWSKRHNLRFRYNGRVNEPSTNQLYDGIISESSSSITMGNPNLDPSFTNRFNVRYQQFIPENASSIMFFLNFSHTMNDIVTINRWEDDKQINTYENIDGNMNGSFRGMYNTPLRNKKFSIIASINGNYTRDNTFTKGAKDASPMKNTANVISLGENLRLKFNSDAFQFDLGGNFSFENTHNSIADKDGKNNKTVYDFGGFGNFTWYLPYDFALESDVNYSSNAGYESGYSQNQWLWNASLSKQFLKGKNATVRIKMYDILNERTSISRSSDANKISYSSSNTISRYFMVNLIFRFQSFKGGVKSSDMQNNDRPRGPRDGGGGYNRGGRF